MISISFYINNPFRKNKFKNLFSKHGNLTTNKAWEVEAYYDATCLITFRFDLSFKGDHAGLSIDLGLLGFGGILSLYDKRHWDYEKDCWETI